jgi:hypothetical protein
MTKPPLLLAIPALSAVAGVPDEAANRIGLTIS